jgi:mono/diheme cytochrome c family protein
VDPNRVIFVAYTPGNQQLQIIGAGKSKPFDFRVVDNYQAGNRRPTPTAPASLGLCLACHQGGGPIFPEFGPSTPNGQGWDETQQNSDIENAMLSQKNLDPFARYALARSAAVTDERPYNLNSQVDESNVAARLSPAGRASLCQNVCGSSRNCRKALMADIVAQVTSGYINEPYYTQDRLKKAVATLTVSGRSDLVLDGSDTLNDRVPTGDGLEIAPGAGNDPLIPRALVPLTIPTPLTPNAIPDDTSGQLGFINSDLLPGQTPINLSPLVNGMSVVAGVCIKFTPEQQNVLMGLAQSDGEKLYKILDSPTMDSLTADGHWPPTGREINTLFEKAGAKLTPDMRDWVRTQNANELASSPHFRLNPDLSALFDTKHRSDYAKPGSYGAQVQAFLSNRTGTTPIPHTQTTQLYTAYCASCHIGSPSLAPALPLDNLAALKTYVGSAGRTVQEMLEAPDKIMPPPGSLMPTDSEREEMLQALQNPAKESASQMACEPAPDQNSPSTQAHQLAQIQQAANFGICIGCHSGPGPIPPHIPFNDPERFKSALEGKASFTTGTLLQAIDQRTQSTGADRMPPPPLTPLTSDEQSAISSYLKWLMNR